MSKLPTGTITLLFTDIERSMHLLQQLSECRELLRTAFRKHHGHEVDTQGDAFFVAFARASEAISAGVAAQRALTTYSWPEGVVVRVRMGIHTGEPSLVSKGYVGLDVHHAARIMSAGHGGQVVLSQTTRDLVQYDLPDGVSLRDLGEHRLKDLQRPSHLYQLVIEDLPADFPPLKTLDNRPNNLPVQLTPLIGREREVAAVQHLLQHQDVRLMTLTGPGGTGKTRLGLQVAAELSDLFTDGVYFVNLAPIRDPEFVVPTIAQTLGIREVADQSLLERVKEELRQQQVLVVLDNFEQVVSAAVQVADLLAACPKLKVIVTSRAVLHVRGEQEFAVSPLSVPDPKHLPDLVALSQYEAVAIFIQRAQTARPGFEVTNANAPAVAEICVRLDGLPLAIELAAARIKLLPPQALLARLGRRLQMLTGGARDAPARQQTLRNTMEWSYQLLDAAEQQLFWRLSVFVGGCTLEAVEAVCTALGDEAGQVVDGMASLIDNSLVQQTEQEGQEPRFVMLETIREYGLERLATSGGMEATQYAHAAYYLALVEQGKLELEYPQQLAWLERLEREHDNLRAALSWSLEPGMGEEIGQRRELGLRLAGALSPFWTAYAHLREGQTLLERARAASAGAAPGLRAKVLVAAANVALHQRDGQRAEALAEEGLVLCRQVGDRAGIAFSLFALGLSLTWKGEHARARSLLEESVALLRELGHKEAFGWSVYALGELDTFQGKPVEARAHLEEALALFRELGHKAAIGFILLMLARVLFTLQGDVVTARALLDEGQALWQELGELGAHEVVAWSLLVSTEIALSEGDLATARSQAEDVLALSRALGLKADMAASLSLLARVEARQGNYRAARNHFEEILTLAREVGDKGGIALYLEQLAEVVAAQGEGVWAARLWGVAETLREAIGSPLIPVFRPGYERAVAATRTRLGGKEFAAAWAEGRTMTLEQVLTVTGRGALSTPTTAGQPATTTAKTLHTYPAGLTAREVEVLRLLAQGLTSAQIAEQLIIGVVTVNFHVRSIYSKLGVTSRSAATRYALEHHLV